MNEERVNEPIISIIVPVYNVEKYLNRCIDSILNQTFTDFELILVDDGSPDNCGEICDKYAKKDNRINVIHKHNGGLSSARNAGLDRAIGKYISFIDSDDYISRDTYSVLLKIAYRYDPDIIEFEVENVYESTKCEEYESNVIIKVENKNFALKRIVNNPNSNLVCNKLYKKEIISEIKFNNELKRFEDIEYTAKAILNCNKYVTVDRKLYKYFQREDSLCRAKEYCLEVLYCIYSQKLRLDYFRANSIDNNIIYKSEERYCKDIFRHYNLIRANLAKAEKDNGVKFIKNIIDNEYKSFINNNLLNKYYFKIKLFRFNHNLYYIWQKVYNMIVHIKNGFKIRILKINN